jgi:Protein of unknown function (DUF1569)
VKTLARRRDRDEILARLRTVRADSQRRWGRMSAHQMICHLSDAFLMVQGRKPVRDRSSVLQRTVVKWIALYAPMRWPRGILTSAEIDQEIGGTRPADFAADVAQVERLVELVTTRTRATEWEPHPIFGRLSVSAWLRWAYLHMDHHLRQFGA